MASLTAVEIAIWNRAALEKGGTQPRAGDAALHALLFVHGLTMNGGVLHAVECVKADELQAARAAYCFFGFQQVAALLDSAVTVPAEAHEKLERTLDQEYGTLIPNDGVLRARFREHFATHREQYAPIAEPN